MTECELNIKTEIKIDTTYFKLKNNNKEEEEQSSTPLHEGTLEDILDSIYASEGQATMSDNNTSRLFDYLFATSSTEKVNVSVGGVIKKKKYF